MANDKDSAVLAERVERVTKWLDGGCSTWGTPMQDIREILNALRQPPQSDSEVAAMKLAIHKNGPIVLDWMGDQLSWRALDGGDWTALQEQSK